MPRSDAFGGINKQLKASKICTSASGVLGVELEVEGGPPLEEGVSGTTGLSLCEVGIQFSDDFIEWSVSFSQKPFPPACDIAKELARQSIANSK